MTEKEARKEKLGSAQRWNVVIAIALILVVTLFGWGKDEMPVTYQFGEAGMTVTGPEDAPFAVELSYKDIISVSEAGELDTGDNLTGVCTDKCWFGTWKNEAYGEYTLCALPSVSQYIVLETTDGVVVCNYQSADATRSLYTALVEWLEEKQQEG